MVAMPARTVYPHITKDPGVRGGRACIDGTRIAVLDIVCLLKEGRRPDEMVGVFASPLSLAQIHAALAYYYDHPNEIEASFVESERWEVEYERERAEYLRRHPPG
jgi:uncharacterized protein (DUF433 family)